MRLRFGENQVIDREGVSGAAADCASAGEAALRTTGKRPLRIVLGTESFAPNISGVAVTTELLAESLAKAGHEVHVFAPSRNGRTHLDPGFRSFSVLRIRSVPNPFRKSFRISLMPRGQIARALDRVRPDIIHLQDPTSICTSLRKEANKRGIPVIAANHFSLDYALSYVRYLRRLHPQMRSMLRRYLVRFYNRCDYVLCPTETVKKELESWGIITPIEAISNGVDLERFYSYSSPVAVRLKYHLPFAPIVLYVGRIDKDKNLEVLISAVPEVVRAAGAHFVIVGDGDELAKLKAMAGKLGIERHVSFIGWVDHESEDLPQLYQIASVFAIPSAFETQSIVTLEALASGLPVVAADSGALPELVKDGENGYLFPSKKPAELASRIVEILKDDDLSTRMRKKSLEAVSHHQICQSFARIETLYEQTLRKTAPH